MLRSEGAQFKIQICKDDTLFLRKFKSDFDNHCFKHIVQRTK